MGRESWPYANGMLIIWQSSFRGNAVSLRLPSNNFYAYHGFYPWLSNATAPQLSSCFVCGTIHADMIRIAITFAD